MSSPPTSPWLELAAMGSFHVGGREALVAGKPSRRVTTTPDAPATLVDPNGVYQVEHLYAQYFIPHRVRGAVPLLLWHGAPLTGVTYETTPDGREGWATYFLRQGWSVYVSDAVERGRAGWAPPEIWPGDPSFVKKGRFFEADLRIGKGPGSYSPDVETLRANLLPGSQSPVEGYDNMTRQVVPRWRCNNEATLDAYVALIDRVGPCAIVAHSQAAHFVFKAAQQRPGKVRAIVAAEPGPIGGYEDRVEALQETKVLYLWGGFVDQDPEWSEARTSAHQFRDLMLAAGISAETIELLKIGISGNSHMLMMDRNNLDVAAVLQDWFARHGFWR